MSADAGAIRWAAGPLRDMELWNTERKHYSERKFTEAAGEGNHRTAGTGNQRSV